MAIIKEDITRMRMLIALALLVVPGVLGDAPIAAIRINITSTGFQPPSVTTCFGAEIQWWNIDDSNDFHVIVSGSVIPNTTKNAGDGVFSSFIMYPPVSSDEGAGSESGPQIEDSEFINVYAQALPVGFFAYHSPTNPLVYAGNVTIVPCLDACDGVMGSDTFYDVCGVCGGDNTTCVGCDGVLASGVDYDGCGVCGGISECDDACGIPFGNGSTCVGCDGIASVSPTQYDACGVCDGRNRTCSAPALLRIDMSLGSHDARDLLFNAAGICQGDTVVFRSGDENAHSIEIRRVLTSTNDSDNWPIVFDEIVTAFGETAVPASVLTPGQYPWICAVHGINTAYEAENGQFTVYPTAQCFGCDNVKGSGRVNDSCGNCAAPWEPAYNNCTGGCNNLPFSNATYDACGVCGGNNTACTTCTLPGGMGIGVEDKCGVCRHPDDPLWNTTCLDFCGVAAGTNCTCFICVLETGARTFNDTACNIDGGNAVVDECGVCGGDNSLCTPQTLLVSVTLARGIEHVTSQLLDPNPPGVACLGDNVTWVFSGLHSLVSGRRDQPGTGTLFRSGGKGTGETFSFGAWPGVGTYEYFDSTRAATLPNANQTIRIENCTGCDGLSRSRRVNDTCGVCGGPGPSCMGGCTYLPGTWKRNDTCGVCGGDNSTCVGCDGVLGSGLAYDACGVCGGDSSTCRGCDDDPASGFVLDACGDCLHPSDPRFSDACRDCAGVPNGGAVTDSCGVCGGANVCIATQSPTWVYVVVVAVSLGVVGTLCGFFALAAQTRRRKRRAEDPGGPSTGAPGGRAYEQPLWAERSGLSRRRTGAPQ
jgi:hypothetical protein